MIKYRYIHRLICLLLLILVCWQFLPVQASDLSRGEQILQGMSAEEKVGQLFLVTFNGTDVGEGSQIYQLINQHHIGGVVLLAENDNFSDQNTAAQTQTMINTIQQHAWHKSSWGNTSPTNNNGEGLEYVPLFIGMKQLGNGFPGDQLLTGLTELPSQMAIAATWNTDQAANVGALLGEELHTLGVNLYLGPNLDVLETSNNQASLALGVNTYGGDPFWVGEMAKAFTSGLRAGSNQQIMVVAQNFPGIGNADRQPDVEVATVRKSLEQLKQFELAPYFSVTVLPVGDPGRVDGVMVSHIRYQGFQGNIRATTRPVSFDSNALQLIMSLPQLAEWRENGGLIISDNLGSQSVRNFFMLEDPIFDGRQVARNAFLAGNDMLYLDNLVSSGDPDSFTSLQAILDFFVQKYQEDPVFAGRVDTSVKRILDAKFDLFGDFDQGRVVQSNQPVESLGVADDITFNVAQNAVTLINPSLAELDSLLPAPPRWYEDMVIFTDSRPVSQCSDCTVINDISAGAFASTLVNLYGPQAGGQLLQSRIAYFSFSQLTQVLDNVDNDIHGAITASLRSAEWVIFITQSINPAYPTSNALQRILAEQANLLDGKNVIVFAMDLPTSLDATDITKITAYYALYSKVPSFLDVAARVLMQELEPGGALPVSVNAVGYDLISTTAPDPNQIISLELVLPENNGEIEEEIGDEEVQEATLTPEFTPTPDFMIGDTITIRTGEILDHNQNIVPDGTIVRFNFRITGDPDILQQFDTTTRGGRAYFEYPIEAEGTLEVNVRSEPATQSETLQITIQSDGSTVIFAFTPTPMWSPTPEVEPSPTATDIPVFEDEEGLLRNSYPSLGEWAFGIIIMSVGVGLAFIIGYFWWGSTRWGLRSSLCALIGGLLSYTYLNLGLEGTKYWIEQSGTSFVMEMVVVGLLIGWIGALIWWMRTEGRYPMRKLR